MKQKVCRKVLASLAILTTAAAFVLVAAAGPAYASGTPNIGVATQGNYPSSIGMAQVAVDGCNFHNNAWVWYGVHDTTSADPNAWYGGWVTTGGPSTPFYAHISQLCDGGWDNSTPNFSVKVSVPYTSCNHLMRADATDSDGTGVRTVYFNLDCYSKPQIQVTQVMSLGSGMIGRGQVQLTGSGAVPSHTMIWVGIHDTSCPSEQSHYYGGWVSSDSSGGFAVTTTDVPYTDCGDQFDAYVVDNASTVASVSNHVTFTLYCGPQLYPTGTGYAGRYFNPGQPVTVTFTSLTTGQPVVPAQFLTASGQLYSPLTHTLFGGGTISGTLPGICGYQAVAYQSGQPATLPLKRDLC